MSFTHKTHKFHVFQQTLCKKVNFTHTIVDKKKTTHCSFLDTNLQKHPLTVNNLYYYQHFNCYILFLLKVLHHYLKLFYISFTQKIHILCAKTPTLYILLSYLYINIEQ